MLAILTLRSEFGVGRFGGCDYGKRRRRRGGRATQTTKAANNPIETLLGSQGSSALDIAGLGGWSAWPTAMSMKGLMESSGWNQMCLVGDQPSAERPHHSHGVCARQTCTVQLPWMHRRDGTHGRLLDASQSQIKIGSLDLWIKIEPHLETIHAKTSKNDCVDSSLSERLHSAQAAVHRANTT
jgi:hypothetical protein